MQLTKKEIDQYRKEQRDLRKIQKSHLNNTTEIINEYQRISQKRASKEELEILKSMDSLFSYLVDGTTTINFSGNYIELENKALQLETEIHRLAIEAHESGDLYQCRKCLAAIGDESKLFEDIENKIKNNDAIKKKLRIRRLIVLGSFATLLAAILIVTNIYVFVPHKMCAKAQKYIEGEQYDEAIKQFQLVAEYRTSKKIDEGSALFKLTAIPTERELHDSLIETQYLRAIQALNDGEYDFALNEFNSLNNYKDSQIYSKECLYQEAIEAKNQEKYEEAIEIFKKTENYKNTNECIADCKDAIFERAKILWDKQSFDESNKLFLYLGTYKNSNEFIHAHEYVRETILLQPTCTKEGTELISCWCGAKKEQSIAELGHNYQKSITKSATCEIAGEATYSCSRCDESYSEKIPAIGHNYTVADCTHDSHCTICGNVKSSALGHTTTTGRCTRCGVNFTKPITMWAEGANDIRYNGRIADGNYLVVLDVSDYDTTHFIPTVHIHTSNASGLSWIDFVIAVTDGTGSYSKTVSMADVAAISVYPFGVNDYTITITPLN